jgi:uncharacterized cupredoxin-like copper-binding protein
VETLLSRRSLTLVVGILAVSSVLFAAACGNDDDGDNDDSNGIIERTIVSSDLLTFEPSEVRIPVGQRVRFLLDNSESAQLHDFSIEHIAVEGVEEEGADHAAHGDTSAFDLHVAAEAGATSFLEFTATERGEYTFICSVTGHADAGMTGVLIVE